jgi:hypothetical protein
MRANSIYELHLRGGQISQHRRCNPLAAVGQQSYAASEQQIDQMTEALVKNTLGWATLVGYCLLSAVGTAIAFAAIVAGGAVALAGHQNAGVVEAQTPLAPARESQGGDTFTGMISDSWCGARHKRNSQLSSAECALACVRKGASYVLVDGDRRYILRGGEGPLARLAGERAHVSGTRQGDAILVNSAAPMF